MGNNPTRRIPPTTLQADIESLAALEAIEGYTPVNTIYSVTALKAAKQVMENRRTEETQAAAALDAARDAATDREWEFHNLITLAKTQVEAQFGPDSDELQAVGRKKKSEYARPTRRGSGNQAPTQ